VFDGASRMSYIASCDGASWAATGCAARAPRGGAHLDLAVVLLPVVQALGVLALGSEVILIESAVEFIDPH
jgi:hypothetical protein